MRIRNVAGTATLLIEFRDAPVAETRDLDENTLLDVDAKDNICAITVEHASERADVPQVSREQFASWPGCMDLPGNSGVVALTKDLTAALYPAVIFGRLASPKW